MRPEIKEPKICYGYFRRILRRRWPEAEDVIMKDSDCGSYYAHYVTINRKYIKLYNELKIKAKEHGYNPDYAFYASKL